MSKVAAKESDDLWVDVETKVEETPEDHGDDLRVWLRILACSTLIDTEVRRRLREEFDCTLPRFDLLAQLERADKGMLLSEISRRMMVSAGNLTALVGRMVESGHIKRTVSPLDGRAQIISMTPLGRSFFRKMARSHAEWISDLFADLSASEKTTLLNQLGKLKSSLRRSLSQGE